MPCCMQLPTEWFGKKVLKKHKNEKQKQKQYLFVLDFECGCRRGMDSLDNGTLDNGTLDNGTLDNGTLTTLLGQRKKFTSDLGNAFPGS